MSDVSINNNAPKEPYASTQTSQDDDTFLASHPWVRHYEP